MLHESSAVNGKLRIGIRRLLDKHPLLGGVLASWEIKEGPIETMGVRWNGHQIELVYSPNFVQNLTKNQLESVLIHEVRHVIYGHCFMDPVEWPDEDALEIAQEVTVNEGLRHLPGKPMRLKDYPELRPNTDTQERYAVLAKTPTEDEDEDNDIASDQGDNDDASDDSETQGKKEGKGKPDHGSEGDESESDTQGEKEGENSKGKPDHDSGNGESDNQREKKGSKGRQPNPASSSQEQGSARKDSGSGDSHKGWPSLLENGTQITAEIRGIMAEIRGKGQDLQDDKRDFDNAHSIFGGNGCGSTPGMEQEFINAKPRDISVQGLRQILMHCGGSDRSRGARFDRPSRRQPNLLGIVPAQALLRQRAHALAVIDTSGSMDSETLASIAKIIRRIEDCADITVVECDTKIQRVYEYRNTIKNVEGRGGTDLCPPLDSRFLAKHPADIVIYFTDGDGPAPTKPPRIPVIWALTHGGCPPTFWGMVLQVEGKGSPPKAKISLVI